MDFVTFDEQYLAQLRARDPATQKHFHRYFQKLITLKLRSRLRSREAIEDVCQETFTRVLSTLAGPAGLQHAERLGAYVNSVCNLVLLEHYRKNARNTSPIDDEPQSVFTDQSPGPHELLEASQRTQAVRQALAGLPQRDRDLIRMVLLEELDKDKVCAQMGVTRDYLRVLLHRARNLFKDSYFSQQGVQDSQGDRETLSRANALSL